MNIKDALQLMKHSDGYTLWVGAGLTIHLARAGGGAAPTWAMLCEQMENLAGIPRNTADYPTRFEACLNVIGRDRFQCAIREAILNPLCDSIFAAAKAHGDPNDCVPRAVRQLSALGTLANPIVSFNIETLTTTALAYSGGPHIIRTFAPPLDSLEGLPHRSFGGSCDGKRFRRAIYHVHGAIEASGICVLSRSEYESMSGTLALQLAVHAAFGSRLFIVGMSLEDEYLRNQLEAFMAQLVGVYWFVDSTISSDLLLWALRIGVHTVKVGDWNDFWAEVEGSLPAASPLDAVLTWGSMVAMAIASRTPRAHIWMIDGFRELGADHASLEPWRRAAALSGVPLEPINKALSDAFEADKNQLHAPLLEAMRRLRKADLSK